MRDTTDLRPPLAALAISSQSGGHVSVPVSGTETISVSGNRNRNLGCHFITGEREHSCFRNVDVPETWNIRTGTWVMFPFPGC